MKQHGLYWFKAIKEEADDWQGWVYEIYASNKNNQSPIRESSEWYDTENEAEMAAIEHISLIEKDEG
jgi:hypothetical protein